ncbi:MAG: sugar isomerase domain-containing protein [Bryobacteraceae bacterium]
MFEQYIRELRGILDRIATTQADPIQCAGAAVAAALGAGGIVHAFGSGHSHLIAEEAFFRAGGIVPVSPILDERLTFLRGALESTHAEREPEFAARLLEKANVAAGDAAIIISNSGRNALPIEMAMEMKARRVAVVAITSLEHSQSSPAIHSSGRRLFELADITIDNGAPLGDSAMKIPGLDRRMGPVSTVTGAAIVHSIMMEAAVELLRTGVSVPVFQSVNVPGADDTELNRLMRCYSGRIRYFDV